ncbi:MAG: hypothetical protein ABW023_08095 [Sphingomonas sp.]
MTDRPRASRRLLSLAAGICALALFAAFVVTSVRAVPGLFLEMAPCTSSTTRIWALVTLPIALFWAFAAIGFGVIRPSPWWFLALIVPFGAWEAQRLADSADRVLQAKCSQWSLEEAFRQCRANPAWYVAGRDEHGNRKLVLTAPGNTDAAYSCLTDWSNGGGGVQIEIDRSVHAAAQRQATGRR